MVSCCLDGDKNSCKGPYKNNFIWNRWGLPRTCSSAHALKSRLDCSPMMPEHARLSTVQYLNLHSRSILIVLTKYKRLSYVTISASAGTVSTDHLQTFYLCTIWSVCSRKHLKGSQRPDSSPRISINTVKNNSSFRNSRVCLGGIFRTV